MIADTRTREYQARAMKVMPGPQSNLRMPINIRPTFIERGQGSHLWDVDGNEYIDYMIAAGPGILGQSNPEFIDAMKAQLDKLLYSVSGASQTPMEVDLAEKLVQTIPCAEKVRFLLSGTEAVQLAIRLARAYTGRRYFIRFEGSYHGWLDNVLGGLVHDNPADNPFPYEGEGDSLGTAGRDPSAFEQCFYLPYNDIETLEQVLDRRGHEVAVILVETIQASGVICPKPGYLERVQALCEKYGILLCFDEVVTGFRVALGGAQELLGITPDLAIYGKAVSGGLPLAVLAGRSDVMDLLLGSKVVGAGTFNGYPLGVSAALATMEILQRDDGAIYRRIDDVQAKLVGGLAEIIKRHGVKALINSVRGILTVHFTDKEVVWSMKDVTPAETQMSHKFRLCLANENILILFGGRWLISAAHTDEDVDRTLECADRAVARLYL
ncbi:MAG: aspartate aminotransferase family protein [Actinomycetia bacterium]|nr:aspartate aminotransferase family protein [Actinomycetes bacterium]